MQSSTYQLDGHAQADGRIYVRETHVDATGRVHSSEYLAPAGWTATEYTARMNSTAAALDVALADEELVFLMGE